MAKDSFHLSLADVETFVNRSAKARQKETKSGGKAVSSKRQSSCFSGLQPKLASENPKKFESTSINWLKSNVMTITKLTLSTTFFTQVGQVAKAMKFSTLRTHFCTAYELTWFFGPEGHDAGRSHPFHYPQLQELRSRSLLVFTDITDVRPRQAPDQGLLGVFFGPGSKYNTRAKKRLTK